MDISHSRGSTALHYAAMKGNLSLVIWFLEHGAVDSLQIRNKMGCRPLEMAERFGPHPEVEALLASAMLEKRDTRAGSRWRRSFTSRYFGSFSEGSSKKTITARGTVAHTGRAKRAARWEAQAAHDGTVIV
jgi:ankyrin repeat protein